VNEVDELRRRIEESESFQRAIQTRCLELDRRGTAEAKRDALALWRVWYREVKQAGGLKARITVLTKEQA